PLTATATVTAIGAVAFSTLVAAGVNPVIAAVVILVFSSTEGASPPGGAPIFIASGISGIDPVKTFIPLILYYVIPIGILGWLIAMGWLPIPILQGVILMAKVLKRAFLLSLMGFIVVGILLVLGQVLGLVNQNSTVILNNSEYLSTTAFVLIVIAAVVAFMLHYM